MDKINVKWASLLGCICIVVCFTIQKQQQLKELVGHNNRADIIDIICAVFQYSNQMGMLIHHRDCVRVLFTKHVNMSVQMN